MATCFGLCFLTIIKKLEFLVSCLKAYISILEILQILAIFVIRTSGQILPTYEESDSFLTRNECYLVSVMSFPFYAQFSHSFFPKQHISDRSVTAQHSTVQFLVTECNVPFILCPIFNVYIPLGL